jgi:hypothetical protein
LDHSEGRSRKQAPQGEGRGTVRRGVKEKTDGGLMTSGIHFELAICLASGREKWIAFFSAESGNVVAADRPKEIVTLPGHFRQGFFALSRSTLRLFKPELTGRAFVD